MKNSTLARWKSRYFRAFNFVKNDISAKKNSLFLNQFTYKITTIIFYSSRTKLKHREEDSGSGADTQTSETRESDDYYANLKKLESEKNKVTTVWTTDKSDLDSLDSDYFKNSLHQSVNNVLVNGAFHPTATGKPKPSQPNNQPDSTTKYQVLEIEVHNQNIRHSVTTTTTVTSQSSEATLPLHHQDRDEDTTDSLQTAEADNFEEIELRTDKDQTSDCSANNSCELNINYNTLTLTRHHLESANEFDQSTFEKRLKFKEDRKSVVSYDSIYLSSEGSNEHTLLDESIEDPLPQLKLNEDGQFEEVILTRSEDNHSEANLDGLYSQINKSRPKIISFEPKHNLTSFSDTSTRGTLERLTFISSSSQQKEFQQIEGKLYSSAEPQKGIAVDNQYCSLPDANIGISLRASERIDAKLRLSCNAGSGSESKKSEDESTNLIYDSISRFGRAHKKLRQKESLEAGVANNRLTADNLRASIDNPRDSDQQQVCIDLPLINYTPIFKKKASNHSQISDTIENDTKLEILKKPVEIKSTTVSIEHQIPLKTVCAKQISTTKIEVSNNEQKPLQLIESDSINTNTKASTNKQQDTFASNSAVLTKKKIIVDELAAKANQEIQRENELKHFNRNNNSIRISDTKPTQIAEVYIPIPPAPPLPTWLPVLKTIPASSHSIKDKAKTQNIYNQVKSEGQDINKAKLTGPKKLPEYRAPTHQSATNLLDAKEALRNEFKANLTDTLRKRIAQSRELFNARPIRVTSVDNISKLNASYEINPQLSYKVQFKDKHTASSKMSRPQILKMISDTKRVCSVAPRQSASVAETRETAEDEDRQQSASGMSTSVLNRIMTTEVKQEFQEKVDSVRCYWSKMIDSKERGIDEVDRAVPAAKDAVAKNFVSSIEDTESHKNNYFQANDNLHTSHPDDVTSFTPHVEIIELNGDKQTAVVNSHNFEAQDFDHIRYKVMKSDTFQKNILTHSRKEAQFDGLLQYLQDYSFQVCLFYFVSICAYNWLTFQELLANNNVVIIEPVRTKIEKIGERNTEPQAMNCKITNGSGAKTGNAEQKANLKRHFFYHPIRVNKELLDEEMPTPDTVRNARKLFEETLRLRTVDRLSLAGGRDEGVPSNGSSAVKTAAENLRKKTLRHLTIDTSFGGVGSGGHSGGGGGGERRWDSASMSSGVSSGELSSPCECNDEQKDMFSSEENICDDELCESYYVSQVSDSNLILWHQIKFTLY